MEGEMVQFSIFTWPVVFGFAIFSSRTVATSTLPLYEAHVRAVQPPCTIQSHLIENVIMLHLLPLIQTFAFKLSPCLCAQCKHCFQAALWPPPRAPPLLQRSEQTSSPIREKQRDGCYGNYWPLVTMMEPTVVKRPVARWLYIHIEIHAKYIAQES